MNMMKVLTVVVTMMVSQTMADKEPTANVSIHKRHNIYNRGRSTFLTPISLHRFKDARDLTWTWPCSNNYVCPANSYRIPHRLCYDTFDDCACNSGYYKYWDKCVPIHPVPAPVKPPTKAPIKPPTKAPVKPPTKAPVQPPTKAPITQRTMSPTRAPRTMSPTRAPRSMSPTRAPRTKSPTRSPVKPPTNAPVKPPTSACVFPPKTLDFSIITWGDATIAGHSLYKGVGIGGTFYDGSPTEYGTVDRTMSYIQYLDPNEKFHFNGGLTVGQTVPQSMYDQFIYLALNAVSAKYNDGYEVFVLTRGGTYDLYDFVYEGQGENNGKTLVIFNTHEDVTLTSIHGRQFGPSVLAPFSKVIVLGDAGYVDGFIVGKTVHTSGPNASGLQFHGDGYTGPLTCK